MIWEKCQLFSFEANKKIMEQLPGGARASCIALLLALDSLEKYKIAERALYSFVLDLGKSCYQSWKI